ncbi:transcription factor ORG3-like [Glycine soja]|uniref:Transcription factor ORG2 n=1 Tax=Glycine soja TaxID=3848 RepID=A0A0B2Q528_GLYSO|nr:transcription factor ORG3-like [Glycine soja]KHN14917.1 Transcription factor ORG2 [Glycine soja]RZB47758.1 Transcription factor ORG2 isoform A [Glycine soja]RZB47759.1 Transcription factor ORG2 isoform B [Glycine soja]
MVALFSPPVFSTKGWLLEEEPLSYDVSSEYSFPYQFYSPQTQIEVEIESSTAPSPDDPAMVKKLSHNASERDRRKKINNLVSSLRSLLPVADQTKKMSIPATVSRVIKYIPELQQQVQSLTKKKEVLLWRISRQLQGDAVNKESQRKISQHNSEFVVSTSRLNDCEVVVHISYEAQKAPLSEILHCLENNGLYLLNGSSSETFGGRAFHNLHFQVEKTQRLESGILTENLLSIYQNQRIL